MMKEWIDIFGKALFNDFDDEDVMIANLFNEWEATPYTWIFLLWSFVFFLGTEDSSKTPYVFERKSIYISSWKIPHDDPPLKIRITTLTNKIPSLKQPSHPENRVFAASSIECTPPKTDIGTKNDGPWKMHLGHQISIFWGESTAVVSTIPIGSIGRKVYLPTWTSWWFQIFFFTPIWGRFQIWQTIFRWVETTNQWMVDFDGWNIP